MSESTPAPGTPEAGTPDAPVSLAPVGTSATILGRALVYGAILAIAIAVVGSIIGYLIAGTSGLLSALVGAVVTAVFMGFTAVSILVAARVTRNDATSVLFFGVILGFWIFKFIAFILIVVLLRLATWVDPLIMFVSILVAVIGSLVVDVLAFVKTRVPYVDDAAKVIPNGPSTSE
jgi:hypothetical protein